jgi:quinohemoprotein amine dehydrogenase
MSKRYLARLRPGAVRSLCLALPALAAAVLSLGFQSAPEAPRQAVAADTGFVIHDPVVLASCGGCHTRDEQGRLSRISYLRKTPEGWQTSIRRMVTLHGARLQPDAARQAVRYLSDHQGLAPEELRPGRFEVEQRTIEYKYEADRDTERTCNACHSMGRIITQRRTPDEWKLLVATHRALYPLVDFQRFRRGGPPAPDATGPEADPRHPMDKAVEHLSKAFPLESAEWAAWSANLRPPRLEGTWAVSGHDPARGPVHGTMTVRPVQGSADEFETETLLRFAEGAPEVRRTGRSVVYTGYQWRGRSSEPSGGQFREVMHVERGWGEMSGRWYTGEYGELGADVTLRRLGREPLVTGVHPRALRRGANGQEVRVFGANLPASPAASAVDFGPGVRVREVRREGPDALALRVDVAADAPVGERDLFLDGVTHTEAVAVFDRVDAIRVLPAAGMARVGGEVMPRQLQQFEAIAYHDGPDGKSGTPDDLELGRVPVSWSIEEYPVTYEDDDTRFVGSIDAGGLFTPAADGPNPERSGNRNNIGEVYVVATYAPPEAPADARPLRARAHLLVTVPLYMSFDPWRVTTVPSR